MPRRRIFRHAGCEAELDHAGRCPVCAATPAPGEVVVHPGPGLAGEPEPPTPSAGPCCRRNACSNR